MRYDFGLTHTSAPAWWWGVRVTTGNVILKYYGLSVHRGFIGIVTSVGWAE